MSDSMLSVAEVAGRLSCHRRTVTALIAAGELPATNISGGVKNGIRWRIDPADLDRWLRSRRNAA